MIVLGFFSKNRTFLNLSIMLDLFGHKLTHFRVVNHICAKKNVWKIYFFSDFFNVRIEIFEFIDHVEPIGPQTHTFQLCQSH